MTRPGIKRGLNVGQVQGLKSGINQRGVRSGLKGGLGPSAHNNYPIQNPATLDGGRLPWFYMNADDAFVNSNTVLIPDVLKIGYKLSIYYNDTGYNNGTKHPSVDALGDGSRIILGSNISGSNRPYIKNDGTLGLHNYLDCGGLSGSNPSPWLSPISSIGTANYGLLEYSKDDTGNFSSSGTVIMVMRSKGTADKTLLNVGNLQSPTTGPPIVNGAFSIYQDTTTTLTNYCWGDTNGAKTSQYKSCKLIPEIQDWMLVTAKYNFQNPMKIAGLGSEQAFYVNSKLQHQLVYDDWDTFSSNPTTVYQPSQPFVIGTDSYTNGTGGAGMDLAAFIFFPRWLNESQQFRIENYFRQYYNKRF